MPLRAYAINEFEIWAGVDLEDAIRAAMASYQSGTRREDVVDPRECREVSPDARVYYGTNPNLMKRRMRVSEVLAKLAGPGLVSAVERL